MTKLKKALSLGIASLSVLALAACQTETTTERNTQVPYGTISENTIVASAPELEAKLNQKFYYDRLRSKSYDTFIKLVKSEIYAKELNAVKCLITMNYSDLTSDVKKTLSYDGNEITESYYNFLRKKYTKSISSSLASSMLGTNSAEAYIKKTAEELEKSKQSYIDSMLKTGYTISLSDIEVSSYDLESDQIYINFEKLPEEIMNEQYLTYAEYIYSKKNLYTIAAEEYLTETNDDGEETEVKNDFYVFNESNYKSYYNNAYYTYGTYTAVIIQFNTRREALENISDVLSDMGATAINDSNVEEFYTKLYNRYYNYRGYTATDVNDSVFEYTVSADLNELSDLTSSIKSLITDTLENGDYLTEARNISDKYIMAYRVKTEYDYNDGADVTKQIAYDYLEDDYADYDNLMLDIKRDIIESYASSYSTTALKDAIEKLSDDGNFKIIDPFLEYKFYYSYTDEYNLIAKEDFNNDYVFILNDTKYTVGDFYNLCSKKLGSSIINDYFLYSYVNQWADEYVDSDTQDSNSSTLDSNIEAFNNNENSTYPAEVGLETYLLGTYGYTNKEDIITYYYNGTASLTAYRAEKVFTEWALEEEINDKNTYILKYLLEAGNKKYDDLYSISMNHVLINIDDDGDGSPDDPSDFLEKLDATAKVNFQNAIAELAKAIYTEATYADYSDNTLYENLNYIVKQYNKGATLRSNTLKTWDDYKTYNFLLTVEELGEVDQDTVSNYVTSFGDYIEELYDICNANSLEIDDENGTFVFTDSQTFAGGIPTSADDISYENLCATEYGYHMIIVTDYDAPESMAYTEETDKNKGGYQAAIELILEEADEDDEDSSDVIVILNSYNDSANSASFNQFFIYYVQAKTGATSSLDSSIYTMMSTLFSDVISTYESTNFQNLIMLDKMEITSDDTVVAQLIQANRQSLVHQITDFDDASEYAEWCVYDKSETAKFNWNKPNGK